MMLATKQDLATELAEMTERARHHDGPLSDRLALVADHVRRLSPAFSSQVDAFVGRLKAANAGANAPAIGTALPGFVLPDQDGRLVDLRELHRNRPAVIVLHRGHWCPYCQLALSGLGELHRRMGNVGLVSISPERSVYARALREDAKADFPILFDLSNGYALSINLAIWVDDAMSSLITAAGWDVPSYNGASNWLLPIPAVFVVDRDGIITARHFDPDYRRRMDLEAITAAVAVVR